MQTRDPSTASRLLFRSAAYVALLLGLFAVLIPWIWNASGVALLTFDAGAWRWAGLLPVLAGSLAYGWGAVNLAWQARKTPAISDRPRALATGGLYRVCRNPMYAGVVVMFAGDALLYESFVYLFYAAGVWLLFHLFVIFNEEPALRRLFPEEYPEYCHQVPRWLPIGKFKVLRGD